MDGSVSPAAVPLSGRPVHDDVDPEDLHGIEGVGEVHEGGQGDESEGRNAPAEKGKSSY